MTSPGRTRRVPLAAAVAALALSATSLWPAAAVVRFEPTPVPVPDQWTADVGVAVPWAGVSMRLPGSWTVSVKREPVAGMGGGASLLAAFGPDGSLCLLDGYGAANVESWQDVGIHAAAELDIGGYRAERFDDMLGSGSRSASAYSIYADEYVYSLMCSADQAPADRWLSIAESIEVVPPGS